MNYRLDHLSKKQEVDFKSRAGRFIAQLRLWNREET